MRFGCFILSILSVLLTSTACAQVRSHQFELAKGTLEEKVVGNDKKAAKRMLVFDAIAQDLPWSSVSLSRAALVFQHTNTEHEPDDGEEYRSQEMHLLTFFLYKESHRIETGGVPTSLLGPYRYTVVMGLPRVLSQTFVENPHTKKWEVAADMISDEERLRRGFPFALYTSLLSVNANPLSQDLRSAMRDEEVERLHDGDQLTRAKFKKDEMIFNRYIERVEDAQRRARLYEMMAEDVLWDAHTLHRAAIVLNDTQSTLKKNRKIRFQLQENHLLAFFLARQAFLRGEREAAPLVAASLNTYLKVSKMPDAFGLILISGAQDRVCQKEVHVSVEQWGKFEFPFHLGRVIKPLCETP